MSGDNKKAVWLALAGAGALVGAALIFHFATASGESDEPTHDDLMNELKEKELDNPVK